MIITGLLQLAYGLISSIIGFLPDSTGFPIVVVDSARTLGGYFGMFSPLIPIGTMAAVMTLVFSIEIGVFGWKTVKSIASHIPWIGGAGH